MANYIKDKQAIIKLEGLQAVLKVDASGEAIVSLGPADPDAKPGEGWASREKQTWMPVSYNLEIIYDNQENLVVRYKDEQDRDSMFENFEAWLEG